MKHEKSFTTKATAHYKLHQLDFVAQFYCYKNLKLNFQLKWRYRLCDLYKISIHLYLNHKFSSFLDQGPFHPFLSTRKRPGYKGQFIEPSR